MTGSATGKHPSPTTVMRRLRPVVVLAGLMLLAINATAQTTLEAVSIDPLPGGQLQIRFRLSQPLTAPPASFTINDPARIVIDFPNTRNGLSTRQQTIGSGVAQKLNVLEAAARARRST